MTPHSPGTPGQPSYLMLSLIFAISSGDALDVCINTADRNETILTAAAVTVAALVAVFVVVVVSVVVIVVVVRVAVVVIVLVVLVVLVVVVLIVVASTGRNRK